jgi:hypothetical protein
MDKFYRNTTIERFRKKERENANLEESRILPGYHGESSKCIDTILTDKDLSVRGLKDNFNAINHFEKTNIEDSAREYDTRQDVHTMINQLSDMKKEYSKYEYQVHAAYRHYKNNTHDNNAIDNFRTSVEEYAAYVKSMNSLRKKIGHQLEFGTLLLVGEREGEAKCIGHLALSEIESFGTTPEALMNILKDNTETREFISSAAIYFDKSRALFRYHYKGLQKLLQENSAGLEAENWPTNPDEFMHKAASELAPKGSTAAAVLKKGYDDRR